MSDTAYDETKPPVDGDKLQGQEQETASASAAKPSKLFIGKEETPADDETARLRADLQRHKVEEGRVKSLSEKNKALEKELEDLRKQVSESKKPVSPVDHVDPSRRHTVDEEILEASADMIRGSSKDVLDDVERRIAPIKKAFETEREARIRAESESFDTRIEQLHAGFAAETNPGGKYVEKWTAYLDKVDPRTGLTNGEILSKAYGERRIEGVNTMIDEFKRQTGISRRESMKGAAFPNGQPQNADPGGADGDQTRYTLSQYKAALEKASQDFSTGKITSAEKNAVLAKFKKAAEEGRVVRDSAPQVGV